VPVGRQAIGDSYFNRIFKDRVIGEIWQVKRTKGAPISQKK
jgi:hypothetical protein